MVKDIVLRIMDDGIADVDQFYVFQLETGFFQDFTPGCFLKGLSKFLFSTWKTPFSLAGRFPTTDKQHLIFLEKNNAAF